MEDSNNTRRREIVELLTEAVDSMLEITASRGLAVDAAVKEYAEGSDNELARVFKEEYVKICQCNGHLDKR